MTDKQKAIIRYGESHIEKEEKSPLERLRYFCSLAMDGEDWVDAGHFFDSLALQVRDKVDVGPWSAGTTSDGRAFLESSDFTHDVRLYVDGDFAWPGDKLSYAQGVARQLNADSNLAVTWDESMSRILAVTRQDSDGQIISVIAVAPPAVTPISEPPPEFRYIAKGDLRLINGQWMTCTDPEIGRWQGSGPIVSAEPVAVPEAILLMAQRIAADDFEHCTSDPIFTVQKRTLITGLDMDYTEKIGWFHDGDQVDDDEAEKLEAAYQESGDVPDMHTRTGIEEVWEHFATYVTMEAAQELVSKKGDQYSVYVDSGCRNHEWKALRAFLLQIAANPVLTAPVATQPDLTQQTLDDVKAGIPARDAEISALRNEIETLRAQQPVSGADQFRDAAQMIEPSGNSGEFKKLAIQKLTEAYKSGMQGKDYSMPRASELLSHAALAQQDTARKEQA